MDLALAMQKPEALSEHHIQQRHAAWKAKFEDERDDQTSTNKRGKTGKDLCNAGKLYNTKYQECADCGKTLLKSDGSRRRNPRRCSKCGLRFCCESCGEMFHARGPARTLAARIGCKGSSTLDLDFAEEDTAKRLAMLQTFEAGSFPLPSSSPCPWRQQDDRCRVRPTAPW